MSLNKGADERCDSLRGGAPMNGTIPVFFIDHV